MRDIFNIKWKSLTSQSGNWWVRVFSVVLIVWLQGFESGLAQKSIRDSTISLVMIDVSYGGYFPSGDFAKRFGYSSLLGGSVGYKFKNNIYVTLGANFLFGDQIKENSILKGVSHYNTYIDGSGLLAQDAGWIDRNGEVVIPSLAERGITIPLRIGKILPVFRPKKFNPNTGFYVETGAQWIQHSLSISAPTTAPYLSGDYEKGYDRLTQGLGILGSVGFRYFGSNRFFNFFVSFDYQHNFTRNMRYNFDLKKEDTTLRNDILTGFRFGWTIPLYKEAPDGYYYY